VTSTATQTATSTVTQTNSTTPGWAYGVMVVLLLAGLAIGYVVKRPRAKGS
jgi:protein-S-isoprenylcysteine O-methyltransferase Ste14